MTKINVDEIIRELARLRSDLERETEMRRNCENELLQLITPETADAMAQWPRVAEIADELAQFKAKYTALLIDLRALVERLEQQRQRYATASREYNHAGDQNLDAYNDGKAMALGDVLNDLTARLSREP